METKTLEVGDMLYAKSSKRLGEGYDYSFYKVAKITPKRAFVENVGNSHSTYWVEKEPDTQGTYKVIGDRWAVLRLSNDNVVAEYNAQMAEEKMLYWFKYKKKFTKEEKILIYKHFEALGKLENT